MDPSGRWQQLAAAVPGAVIFAVMHAKLGDATSREAVGDFFGAVLNGVPFRQAVQPLLEDWSLLGGRLARAKGATEKALARIAALPPAERAAQVLRQRLLLRRALAGIKGEHLWVPAPEDLVPEHIPRTPRLQQRWFRVMAAMASFGVYSETDRHVRRAFLRWLSANATHRSLRDSPPQALYLAVQRHHFTVPSGMSPSALVAQVDAWWNEEAQRREPRGAPLAPEPVELLDGDGGIPWDGPYEELPLGPPAPCTPWPELLSRLAASFPEQETRDARGRLDLWLPTPFPGCDEPGLTVRPLQRASELREEGRAMQHCAARYLEEAVLGQSYFFHVVARGMPLTVQLRGPEDVAWLQQMLGHRNRSPDPERAQLVVEWWQRVARAHGLAPEPPPQPMPDVPF